MQQHKHFLLISHFKPHHLCTN